ncbi:MAG TPA: DUF6191 domain-containing protein [Actinocatenispora sp.]
MGLLQWMRGDSDSPTSAMLAAGLGELSGVLSPGKRKQTELIQELQNKREDVNSGAPAGLDLDNGVAVIRRRTAPQAAEPTA